MKKFKKVISLLMAVVMLTMLCACGGTSSSVVAGSTAGSGAASTSGSAADGKGEYVKLKWYFPMLAQTDQDMVFEAANKMLMEDLNLEVDFTPISFGDYNQKMQVIISAGDEFDICFTSNTRADYFQNSQRGAFIPLDGLLDEYAPNLKASIPERIWNATHVGGQTYGIPNYQIAAVANVLWFPKELVEKYDFDYASVQKLEDLEPYFDEILANEPGVTPFAYQKATTNWGYLLSYYGFDEVSTRNVPGTIRVSDESCTVVNQFATEEFKSHVELMHNWYEKDYFRPDAASVADWTADLKAGKYAACFDGTYKPGGDSELSIKYGLDIVTTKISDAVMSTGSIVSTLQAISKTSKHPERAMEFLEYLNTNKEFYNLLCYGIEGTHYEMAGDERIELIGEGTYNPGIHWVFGTTFNSYRTPGQPDDVWEQTKEINNNAQASPLLGFAFDAANVSAEIAQCKAVVDEYIPSLDSGSVDPDKYLPEFLSKLEASGVDKIISEMQTQVDAWLASK